MMERSDLFLISISVACATVLIVMLAYVCVHRDERDDNLPNYSLPHQAWIAECAKHKSYEQCVIDSKRIFGKKAKKTFVPDPPEKNKRQIKKRFKPLPADDFTLQEDF